MTPLVPANLYGPYRYARAERFGPPQVVPNLEPVEAALCPQNPPTYTTIMGPQQNVSQSEDCLQLMVYAQATRKRWDPNKYLPVMVYIHGGSFIEGGGVLDWYDGRRLAQLGVVVVSINYRLGALGFLALEGGDTLNGHRDMLAALQWVKDHASDFGGDPDRVTLFGQDAGALAIAGMYRSPDAKPYYSSAIMQSPPLSLIANRTVEEARNVAADFTSSLGKDPRQASLAEILAAQSKVAGPNLPFFPLVEGEICAHGPLIAGWNKEDAAGWSTYAPGENATGATEALYAGPVKQFEDELKAAGCESSTYVFSIDPGPWGAVHSAELPYLLGTPEAWMDSPMLNGTSWYEINAVGLPMRRAWTDFAVNPGERPVLGEDVPYLTWLD